MEKKRKQKRKEKYISWDKSKGKYRLRVPGFPDKSFQDLKDAVEERNIYVMAMESMEKETEIDSGITLGAWIDIWLSEYINTTKPRVLRTYRNDLDKGFSSLYDRPAVSIKGRELSDCLKRLAVTGTAKSSVQRMAKYIRQAYKELYAKGGVDMVRFPTDRMNMPRPDDYSYKEKPKKSYELADLLKLEDAAKEEKEKLTRENFTAALGILSLTGLRISELLGLCKEDVDIAHDRKSLTISITKGSHNCNIEDNTSNPGKTWYIQHQTKSKNSTRVIPITYPATIAAIIVLLEREHPTAKQNDEEFNFLFSTKNGTPISHSSFETTYRRIRERAGYETDIHEFRHSIATIMGNNRSNDTTSSRFLGQGKDVFQGVYVHTSDAANQEIARWLADQKAKVAKMAVTATTPTKVKPTGTGTS